MSAHVITNMLHFRHSYNLPKVSTTQLFTSFVSSCVISMVAIDMHKSLLWAEALVPTAQLLFEGVRLPL